MFQKKRIGYKPKKQRKYKTITRQRSNKQQIKITKQQQKRQHKQTNKETNKDRIKPAEDTKKMIWVME